MEQDRGASNSRAGWIIGHLPEEELARKGKDKAEAPKAPHASYSFGGEDGNGVDLTKGRVKMTVNLPLITSQENPDRNFQAPALLADFEGPYSRIRHKLKIKLGFGFGDKPLGEGDWGQALVMCVPVSRKVAPLLDQTRRARC